MGKLSNLTTESIHADHSWTYWQIIKAITIASLGAFWGYEGMLELCGFDWRRN
jgi:hypothetical protein